MRLLLRSLIALAVGAGSLAAQDSIPVRHRPWSPIVASAGLSVGGSSISSEGDQCIPALGSLGVGVRFHDFAGLEYDVAKMPCDGEYVEFRTISLNVYPGYRSGASSVRVSIGFGKSRIRRNVFAGGHATDVTEGTPSAVSLTMAADERLGRIALSPFFNVARTVGSGLTRQYCSTPNYIAGDFTEVCSGPTAATLTVTTFGLSLGIR
jgi:hypothetical protein